MSLVPTSSVVAAASAAGGAAGAFNVITLEHAEAIVTAAESAGTAVILQISANAVLFHGGNVHPLAAACTALARASTVPIALHLDHVTDDALLAQAAAAGFSSVMFDAGHHPHAENTALTAHAATAGHADGLWVEAELGYVGGKADVPQSAHAPGVRTDPDEAHAFVAETGVDALAVAVGSSHAMTTRSATLDIALIERLHRVVPVPLVLHGSSGVAPDDLRAACRAGIAKVNVGTALNIAMTRAIRAALAADADVVDPRKYLASARDEITATVREILSCLR